jgi:transcriptional regulator with XRE-family HTH domain
MTKGVNNQPLGTYVRTRRESRGLDIRTAAEQSGFHGSYWRKLEAGQYESPDAKHLGVLASVLDCPLEDLYALCGYQTPEGLPSLGPYLRVTSDLGPDEIAVMERIFSSFAREDGEGTDRRAA